MANSHSTDLEKSSSQHWSIAHASQTGLNLTSSLTIEAWIKLESGVTTDSWCMIVHKGDWSTHGDSHYSFSVRDEGGNEKLSLYISNGVNNSQHLNSPNQTFNTGQWYHVAVTYNVSTGVAEFFVDGTSIGTASGGPTTLNGSETKPVRIGAQSSSDSPGMFFDGLIDEVRVWSVIRTGTEINNNKSTELVGNESNLQGYWKFNNNGLDETANNNDLTNNNSATFSTDVPFTGSQNYQQSCNEAVLVVDTFSKTTSRAFAEAVIVADTIARMTGRALSETVVVVDSVAKSASRAFDEFVSVVDSVQKSAGRTFTEAVTLVDSMVKGAGKALSESISVIDSFGRAITRAFAETVSVIDSISKSMSMTFSESLAVVDTISRSIQKVFNEALTVVDTFTGTVISVAVSIGNFTVKTVQGLKRTLFRE